MPFAGLRLTLWCGTAATVGLLWLTDIPLGIPGEWAWNRVIADNEADLWLGLAGAGIVAAVYLVGVWLAERGIDNASRRGVGLRLAGLAVAAFAWLWVVQESPPGIHRLQKAPLVLYTPSVSGYFFESTFRIDDVSGFLRTYEERVRNGDVFHFGTHPPGLFLFHRGLTALCEWSPGLSQLVRSTEPESVRDAFDLIDQFPMGAPARLSSAERASLWLSALVTQAVADLTIVPLYFLVRRSASRRAAWIAAAMWPLIPSLAVFLPKSDTLYPFAGALFLVCWLEASSRRCLWLGLSAGLLLFTSLFFTLAFLPVAALAAVIGVAERWFERQKVEAGTGKLTTGFRAWIPWISGAVGFLGALAVLLGVFGLNLPAVWWHNYLNHARFYEQAGFPRTWWKWLLENPLETTFAVGVPVAVLATLAVGRVLAGRELNTRNRAAALGIALIGGGLWISGKNSGEAARLWLPLFSWAVWLAGITLDRMLSPAETPQRRHPSWLEIAILQGIVCIATVLRVTGFHFGGM